MKNKNSFVFLAFTVLVAVFQPVFAAVSIPIAETTAGNVIELLTGNLAGSVIVIAIIVVGFLSVRGKVPWIVMGCIILAAVFIFGAEDIAKLVGAHV